MYKMRRFWLKFDEIFMRTVMFLCTILIVFILFIILFSIFRKGLPALSWEMISQTPKGGYYLGKEGGILNAIIGSLYLALGSTVLALMVSLPVALYLNTQLVRYSKLTEFVRFLMDLMWGVPSIVYGAFAFTIMIAVGIRASLLAGIITVALFIIPIMLRSMDEILKTTPRGLLESAISLGSTYSEVSYRIYLKQCMPGIVTAFLLSFGRAIGDAAAILFTTGYTDHIPTSLSQPSATLPLSIFFQLSSPIPEVQNRAYASAVVLMIIILIISILSRIMANRFIKHQIKH
jgi:phosphate transport system permease protein